MLPALINTTLLLALSGVHVYWALGGRWGIDAAVPELPGSQGKKVFTPGPIATLLVAAGLALMAGLHVYKLAGLPIAAPSWLAPYGLMAIGVIFLLRAVGDFRYVGFFKRVTDTTFARLDTALYVPLCLVLSICAFWTAVLP